MSLTDFSFAIVQSYCETKITNNTTDMAKNNIDGKFVDEPTPCVYGPPSWYNKDGTHDRRNPEAREFLHEVEEIKERNRKRKEMYDEQQEIVDEPIANVYGPDPSVFAHTDEDKDTDERLADRLATKKPTFFSRLFGLFKKKS